MYDRQTDRQTRSNETFANKQPRAAVYARVSRREQQQGHSLDAQVRDDVAYAERMGYRIAYLLREVGSGKNPERPKMRHLLDLAERRAFDVLVVWRRDRFGRSSLNNGLMDRLFRANGVRIESILTGPQRDSSMTRFVDRMMDAVAELESDSITERFQMGRIEAARKGIWPTKPFYGWRRNWPGKDLVIVEEQAAVIRRLYEACVAGHNTRTLAVQARTCHTACMERIHNPAYKGEAVYCGIQVPVPAIVSPELWQRAQDALATRKRNRLDEDGGRPRASRNTPRATTSPSLPPRRDP